MIMICIMKVKARILVAVAGRRWQTQWRSIIAIPECTIHVSGRPALDYLQHSGLLVLLFTTRCCTMQGRARGAVATPLQNIV